MDTPGSASWLRVQMFKSARQLTYAASFDDHAGAQRNVRCRYRCHRPGKLTGPSRRSDDEGQQASRTQPEKTCCPTDESRAALPLASSDSQILADRDKRGYFSAPRRQSLMHVEQQRRSDGYCWLLVYSSYGRRGEPLVSDNRFAKTAVYLKHLPGYV